jgi:hypothetical protein
MSTPSSDGRHVSPVRNTLRAKNELRQSFTSWSPPAPAKIPRSLPTAFSSSSSGAGSCSTSSQHLLPTSVFPRLTSDRTGECYGSRLRAFSFFCKLRIHNCGSCCCSISALRRHETWTPSRFSPSSSCSRLPSSAAYAFSLLEMTCIEVHSCRTMRRRT